jgi:glycosyltransferase involved in cell wall biosynthesis
MFGTPVIASVLGSFPEFVRDGWNGRFASADDCDGILSALDDIRSRQQEYAVNCRTTFLETFHSMSRLAELESLLR